MKKKGYMVHDLERIFKHTWEFYTAQFSSIAICFSALLVLAYAVLLLAQVPSYPALGAVFLRIISIPDISMTDFLVIGIALILSNFVVADAIVNINLLIKKKRTLSDISTEVWGGIAIYATKVFNVFIIAFLLTMLFQLLTFEVPAHAFAFPVLTLIVSFLLFFTAPAIVIDNEDTITAIARSIELIGRSPLFYLTAIILWGAFGLAANTIVGLFAFFILPPPYASYFIMLVNSIFVFPLLLILQTHIYMEKYPLAK